MRRFCFGLFSSLAFIVSRARLIISARNSSKEFVLEIRRAFGTGFYKLKVLLSRR